MSLLLVDDTDLSKPGSGQQTRTIELYSRVAKYANVKLVLQEVRHPERLTWASELMIAEAFRWRPSWGGDLKALKELIVAARDSDIIIAEHVYGINRLAPLAAKTTGIPFVYDSHGNEVELCRSSRCFISVYPFERYMYRFANAVVAISEEVLNSAVRLYGIAGKKSLVLTPGLREVRCNDRNMRQKLEQMGVREGEVIVITHGSLDYGPNSEALQLLVSTSVRARERYGIVFVVAGASKRLRPGWLSDSVLYIGFVDDLDNLLCSADAAVSLNVSGTGVHMKVLDYLSAGLPLIVTPKSLEGLPLRALEGYPVAIVRPGKSDLGRVVANLIERRRGPFSGRASLPTWDEQAEKLLSFLSSVLQQV